MARKRRTGNAILVNLFRVLVGLLFLLSGLIKVNDILGFSYKLEEYFHVFEARFGLGFSALTSISVLLAYLIAVVETSLALALLLGIWQRFVTLLLLLMIIFFTFLTGYSAITGSVTDCGCFGDALKLSPSTSFIKDIVLTFFIAYLFVFSDGIRPLFKRIAIGGAVWGVLTLVVMYSTWHLYQHLPAVDFLPYKPGNNLKVLATQFKPNGEPVLKDYFPFEFDCDTANPASEFQGPVLLVIYQKLEKASAQDIEASIALTESLKGTPVQVLAATSSGSEELATLQTMYKFNYRCLVQRDETNLKTIVRANPGYLLLKDGLVLGKWHANDIPTREQLETLLK